MGSIRQRASRSQCAKLTQPKANKARPGGRGIKRQEGHQGRAQDTDQIPNGHHEEPVVLPSSRSPTSNDQGYDLE